MTTNDVYAALQHVKDPEIPTISIVDMGIVVDVQVTADSDVHVVMTPTFVGCPAIDVMRADARAAIEALGARSVQVDVNFDTPWSTNRLTEAGKAALLKHGLAPPATYDTVLDLTVLNNAACPYCNSRNTTLKSIFGPTLCRSLHYCNNCLQAFESFKPV